jgi:hypothetical protein
MTNAKNKPVVDMQAVAEFRSTYNEDVVTNPTKYAKTPGMICMSLPNNLKEFCNAAAGTGGIGEYCGPVGIRVKSDNNVAELAEIFASDDNLAAFLLSSDCNADEAVRAAVARQIARGEYTPKKKSTVVKTDDRPVDTVFGEITKLPAFKEALARFGQAAMIADRKVLTVNEYKLRYFVEAA